MITMSTRPLRILVVDDDPAMVGAITALVGTEGHQVITAYDGLTAVKRFREEHPDLVLLDLAMPGPDGFNVAGQMRAVGQAPILVVSGESGEAAKVRALGLGADDYLTKPFGKAELLARIAAVMRRVDRSGGPAGTRRRPADRGRARAGARASRGARRRDGPVADADRIPAAGGARARRWRHRPAPPAGPCRLAGGDRSRSALAQAAPRAVALQGVAPRVARRSWPSAAWAIGSSWRTRRRPQRTRRRVVDGFGANLDRDRDRATGRRRVRRRRRRPGSRGRHARRAG